MAEWVAMVNHDKKEIVRGTDLGVGGKLWEQIGGSYEGKPGDVLFLLVASDREDDVYDGDEEISDVVGRWAGDRIEVVGFETSDYDLSEYRSITDKVAKLLRCVFGIEAKGGQRKRKKTKS